MEIGSLEIIGPRFGLLFFGLSAPRHLWWTDEDGESELVLAMNELAASHLCNACGTVVVEPERY